MGTEVFVSVGRTYRPEQEAFVTAFEEYLEGLGLTPQTLGRNFWSDKQPLVAISEKLDECGGTAILAFERTRITHGFDKPDSDDASPLDGEGLPTVWNQIEAALAYSRGHPLLVLVQEELKNEGLLEQGYDWYVKKVTLGPEAFKDREFIGVVGSWAQAVRQKDRDAPPADEGAQPSTTEPAEALVEAAPPQPTVATSGPIKILFLAANPMDTSRIQLDEEHREIDLALRRARYRDRFELDTFQAPRVTDLQDVLQRFEPHIVHFSGHGSNAGELILQDNAGKSRPVSPTALGKLFKVLKRNIRCVVLNACYSHDQAVAIAQHIDCVIGMSDAIGDEAATAFSGAFYQALAYGNDVNTAFELGLVQIDLDNLGEDQTPRLITTGVDPSTVVFA